MMKTREPVLVLPLGELAVLDMPALAQRCAEQLQAGARLVTLFGRPDAEASWVATAILQGPDGALTALRAGFQSGASYPALTPRFAQAQILERELWEQTGITPLGHPWLKPVRFEGTRQQQMADYPFFKVRGQEVHEVGVGPIHASVIEPGHFRFMCLGERVYHLEVQLGYQHRGIEPMLLRRAPLTLASTVESICGDACIAYAWAYCSAMEALGDTPIPAEIELIRGVALELERIAMHLAALGGLATDIAFLQGGASYGRLRTAIINASMRVCGSRFGRGWLCPGGVRFGLTDALRQDLAQTLGAFARDIAEVNALMLGARSVQARFQGIGKVSTQAARDLGLVGLVARASGVALDTRSSLPGLLHQHWPISSLTESTGDCWARMQLRMREIDTSLTWLVNVLGDHALDLRAQPVRVNPALRPDALCVSLREGTRGPVLHVAETTGQGTLRHCKVQDPSLQNWFGLALAVRDNGISDFPICNKSFDLSYCGNDL